MKILKINIENFRSYRKVTIDDLSSGVNLIFGQNGSGKSNVHLALQFLFTQMEPGTLDEKRTLMNENIIDEPVFVEAVLDNSAKTAPNYSKEITMRKSMTKESFKFSIDGKDVPRSQYYSFIDTLRISRSNAGNLNIVPQQQIKKIAAMSEEELYSLLKETIGTKQYDQKKNESYEILSKTQVEEVKSEKVLAEFKGKIDNLKGDKEQWEVYQDQSKEGDKIYCCIYRNKLEKTKQKIVETLAHSMQLRKKVGDRKNRVELTEQNYKQEEKQNSQFKEDMNELLKEIQTLKKEQESLEQIFDANETLKQKKDFFMQQNQIDQETEFLLQNESKYDDPKVLKAEIQKSENDLARVAKLLEQTQNQVYALRTNYQKSQTEVTYRTNKLSKQEAQKFVQTQLSNLSKELNIQEEQQKSVQAQRQQVEQGTLKDLDIQQKEAQVQIQNLKQQNEGHSKQVVSLLAQQEEASQLMKQTELQMAQLRREEAQKKKEFQLRENLMSNVEFGVEISSLKQLIREAHNRGLQGIHGLLIDFFKIPEQISEQVDQVIGSKLYHIVVQDLDSADKLHQLNLELKYVPKGLDMIDLSFYQPSINGMSQESSSENKENYEQYDDLEDYDMNNADIDQIENDSVIKLKDAISLTQLGLDLRAEKLQNSIFGRVFITDGLQIAQQYSRELQVTCVTFNKEVVHKNGFSGLYGFHKDKKRVENYYILQELESQLHAKSVMIETTQQDLYKMKDNFNLLNKQYELSLIESRSIQQKIDFQNQIVFTLSQSRNQSMNQLTDVKIKENRIYLAIQALKEQILSFEKIVQKEDYKKYMQQASSDEMSKMTSLKEDLANKERVLAQQENDYKTSNSHLQKLNILLLYKESNIGNSSLNKQQSKMEQEDSNKQLVKIKELRDEIISKENKFEILKEESRKKEFALQKKQQELYNQQDDHQKYQKELDIFDNKITDLRGIQDMFTRQLEQYSFREKDLKNYVGQNEEYLRKKLSETLREKNKYTEKDKMNFQKLSEFQRKHDKLTGNLLDVKESKEKFYVVAQDMDEKVQEMNSQMFSKFANHFGENFKKIVPQGSANLQMFRTNSSNFTQSLGTWSTQNQDQQEFGIEIKVNFNSETQQGGRVVQMQHLSPGQKTVIALCIIFSLQKVYPAPFYCFDEPDADLDANISANIAKMLNEERGNSQYFLTTFKEVFTQIQDSQKYLVEIREGQSNCWQIKTEEVQNIPGIF